MNTAKDIADHFINRAKMLNEFIVEVDVPEDFRFNGLIPFDMKIEENVIKAKVWAISFEEAVEKLDEYLNQCK